MTTAQEVVNILIENKFLGKTPEDKDIIAGCIIFRALELGPKRTTILRWLFKTIKETRERRRFFIKYWANLKKNNIFDGKYIRLSTMPDEDDFGIEFVLLMMVAQGLIERG